MTGRVKGCASRRPRYVRLALNNGSQRDHSKSAFSAGSRHATAKTMARCAP
jgi:hypothetical protein